MIHGVAAAFERLLLVIDAIGARRRRDGLRIPRQSDEARPERFQIGFQNFRRIALRIDGDEDRHHAAGLGPELVEGVGHHRQGRRADVGTIAVAEINQHEPAAEIGGTARFPVLVDQGKRPADQGFALAHDPVRAGQRIARMPQKTRRDRDRRDKIGNQGQRRTDHYVLCTPRAD